MEETLMLNTGVYYNPQINELGLFRATLYGWISYDLKEYIGTWTGCSDNWDELGRISPEELGYVYIGEF